MPVQDARALEAALPQARKAQEAWAALPFGERGLRLKKARAWMAAHVDTITDTIHEAAGKLKLDALAAETLPAFMAFDYYLRHGARFMKPRALKGGSLLMRNKRSRLVYRPYGVIGIISPWNYPFAIPFSEVVMALLAGNAVLLKVASATGAVGRLLQTIFAEAGLPAGLFTLAEMPGREAGPAFIEAGIDKLFFTGSTATGKELAALAAKRLLPLVLELGGADAAIVCADADLDRAAQGLLWAGYANAGQSCAGAQRILVHKAVYDTFLEKFCALVSALRPGRDFDADLGPMITAAGKADVEALVARCVEMGATIAARSAAPAPTSAEAAADPFAERVPQALVLTGVTPEMPVMTGEVFGPVTAVVPVQDNAEALRIANATTYSLSASVWSRSRKAAASLARQLNAGAVTLNDHLMSHGLPETPWGGGGDSGLGRTHGELGFREMLRPQVLVDDILPAVRRNLWWHPYSETLYRGLLSITTLLAGPGPLTRLKALPRVLRLLPRYWSPQPR